MPKLTLSSVLAIVALASPAGSSAMQPPAEVERDVRAFARTFQNAIDKKDRTQLERLIAPAFTAIDRAGMVRTREEWITGVVSGRMLPQRSDPEDLSDDLAVFGSTASARTTVFRYQDTASRRDICVKTRTIYARIDGQWRAISMQQTLLHDGPIVTTGFDRVVGTYQLEAGRRFVVTRVGRTLFATLPIGVASVPLFETPDGGLLGPGGEFVYALGRDADGRVTTVTMTRYGTQLWRAKRVEMNWVRNTHRLGGVKQLRQYSK